MTSGVVLGYSGLHHAGEHLAREGGASGLELRFFQGMDAAAALFVDGELAAAVQQERFSGTKADNRFPVDAIRWCMRSVGVAEDDITAVGHGFCYVPYQRLFAGSRSRAWYDSVYSPDLQQDLLGQHFPAIARRIAVAGVRHHVAHALSAAVPSGFGDCLTVVMDGMGETDAVSVFRWRHGQLERLMCLDARSSLGLFYSLLTMHLGFTPNSDEYQVMGLAAYGDPARYAAVFRAAVELHDGGRLTIPLLTQGQRRSTSGTVGAGYYRAGRQWLAERTFRSADNSGLPSQQAADLAAAGQRRLEEAIVHVVTHWTAATGISKVALAGGVALNCVANGKLLDHGVTDLYVQPAAGDEGTAIGAALSQLDLRSEPVAVAAMPYFGPEIGQPSMRAGTEAAAGRDGGAWVRFAGIESATGAAVALLSSGAIVGWAQDRLEFGPRALGNRSILADPSTAAIRDRVNAAVKFRESFRPLAPAVLAEYAGEYFEIPPGADPRHMTMTVRVRPTKRHLIPAVCHVDGTARVQVVERATSPKFWDLISCFRARTGLPVVLNTSLNVKGQPIVRTAEDAVWVFGHSDLDALVVGTDVLARQPWRALLLAVRDGGESAASADPASAWRP